MELCIGFERYPRAGVPESTSHIRCGVSSISDYELLDGQLTRGGVVVALDNLIHGAKLAFEPAWMT